MNESATQQIDEAGKGDQDTSLKPWLCSCPPALHSLTACHSSTSLTLPQGTYTDTFSGLGTGKVEMNQRDQADCKVQVIKFYWVPPSTTRPGGRGLGLLLATCAATQCGLARQAGLPELTRQRDKSPGKKSAQGREEKRREGEKNNKKGFFWYLFSKPLTKTRFEV